MSGEKKSFFKASVFIMLVIGIVMGAFYYDIVTHQEVKSWHVVMEWTPVDPVYAEANPGAGASGFLEIFIMNHTGTDDNAYKQNTSATIEGWCDAAGLGYCNADDSEIDIAHSTNFHVLVRVRGNATHCKSGATWYDTDLRVRWTSADLSVGADTVMTGYATHNASASTYLYMNFWDNNTGSGYSISKGATAEITSIKFEAYY